MTGELPRSTGWKRNVFANALGRASTVIFALIFTPVYVRILGIESYSLVAFFSSLLAMTYVLDITFGATITRELAQSQHEAERREDSRDLARSLEYIYLGASFAMSIACYFASDWIAREWLKVQALPVSEVRTAVAMMGTCVAFQAPIAMYSGGLYGLERQQFFNVLAIGFGAMRGVGAVFALVAFGSNVLVFFSWQMAFGAIQLTCFCSAFWYCMPKGRRAPKFNVDVLKRVAGFSLGMAGTGIVTFFLSQINGLVLSKLVPLPQLGIFQIANQLNSGARIAGNPAEVAAFPRLAYYAGGSDPVKFADFYHEACQTLAFMALPACAIVALFAHPLIYAWLGNAQLADATAPVATLLVLGSTLNNLMKLPYQVTIAKGWSAYGFYQNSIAVVLYVPALMYLVSAFGIIGVAYAWLALNVAFMTIAVPFIHARLLPGQFSRWVAEDLISPIIACGIVVILIAGLGVGALPKIAMLGAITTGWIICSIACAISMPYTRRQLFRLMKRILASFDHAQ